MDKSLGYARSAELSLDNLRENQEKLLINSAKSIYSFLIDQSQSQTGELSSFWSTLSPSGVNPDINSISVVGQENLLKTYYKAFIEKANIDIKYTSYNLNGFLPIGFGLTVNGISGPKFYNRLKVDSEYLPKVYPNQLDYIITGIKHTIENNKWLTIYDLLFYTKSGSYILEEKVDENLIKALGPDVLRFPAYALPNVGLPFKLTSIPADIIGGASTVNINADLNQAIFAANNGFNVYDAKENNQARSYNNEEIFDSLAQEVRGNFRQLVSKINFELDRANFNKPYLNLEQGFRNVAYQTELADKGNSQINFGWHNTVTEVETPSGKLVKPASYALDVTWAGGRYTNPRTENELEFFAYLGYILSTLGNTIFVDGIVDLEFDKSLNAYKFVNNDPNRFQWGGAWYSRKAFGTSEISRPIKPSVGIPKPADLEGKKFLIGWDPYHIQMTGPAISIPNLSGIGIKINGKFKNEAWKLQNKKQFYGR
jgi:hypothetical protein